MISSYFRKNLWRTDLALAWHYGLGQAFKISLRQRPRAIRGEGVGFTYGETPLTAMRRILALAQARPDDTFLELGAGTGRFCMMATRLVGLEATGVEQIPTFVDNARRIAARQRLACRFVQGDLFAQSWSEHSLLYITPTTFTDSGLARFHDKCSELRPGARLISLTHPPQAPGLVSVAMDVLDFSWGPATVFVHRMATPARGTLSR
ncbi:MAG: class I SAM-dependent methyltransferase [Myxococcota bacterium]|nr:class I SAM-dependent methyltransferase [Myxococcota bacterium]